MESNNLKSALLVALLLSIVAPSSMLLGAYVFPRREFIVYQETPDIDNTYNDNHYQNDTYVSLNFNMSIYAVYDAINITSPIANFTNEMFLTPIVDLYACFLVYRYEYIDLVTHGYYKTVPTNFSDYRVDVRYGVGSIAAPYDFMSYNSTYLNTTTIKLFKSNLILVNWYIYNITEEYLPISFTCILFDRNITDYW